MIRAMMVWFLLAAPAVGQDFSGLARIDPTQSSVRAKGDTVTFSLALSQVVPYRVFTVDAPPRLVIDFREVDWGALAAFDLLKTDRVTDLRFGTFNPGWSRLVADLSGPYALDEAGIDVDPQTGRADLTIQLELVEPEVFADRSGAPTTENWAEIVLPAPAPRDGRPVVVIDPGHGGIDPGAVQSGVQEADLMLSLAIEVAEALNRTGNVSAVLTRDSDHFVPLDRRISLARAAGADLFLSLHADALEEDQARGASVYLLSQSGVDTAAQRMAERHERGDLLAGVDLSGQGDRVATVLMDLARAETGPSAERFADHLIAELRAAGAKLNSRPLRQGRLAVLTAADFASVLIEVGFLSSDRDRAMLMDTERRAPLVRGIAQAVEKWVVEEAAAKALLRQ